MPIMRPPESPEQPYRGNTPGTESRDQPEPRAALERLLTGGFVLYGVVVLGYCAYRLVILNG
jgi:hypothetical protein